MKRAVRRSTVLAVLALFVAATAQAAPSPRRSAPEPASLLAAAWNWIVLRILPTSRPALTPMTEKAGCDIDPNGHVHCIPAPPVQTNAGCEIDPNGHMHCIPAPPTQINAGCGIDPNGCR
ncbi:MAG TPA: hypothetical protein VGS07_17565 [Thermoanaerobaculia bacterium]|jgi:hypothetical protein|nr:hypothetical protein [Thermoanaerobaculia bacterium]